MNKIWTHLKDKNRIEKHSNETHCYCTSTQELNRRRYRLSARSTMNFRWSASFHFKFTQRSCGYSKQRRPFAIWCSPYDYVKIMLFRTEWIACGEFEVFDGRSASLYSTPFDSFDIFDSLIFSYFFFRSLNFVTIVMLWLLLFIAIICNEINNFGQTGHRNA